MGDQSSIAGDPVDRADATGPVPDKPVTGRTMAVDPGLRYRMISEAAFDLFAHRGCADGYALDDWLQAEAIVDARIARLESDGIG